MKRAIALGGGVSLVLAVVFFIYLARPDAPPPLRAPQPEGPPLKEFVLTERSGNPFHSRDLEGQIWVASFFFTSCGSNCRMLNMKVAELQREFGPRGVRFVSISCDPLVDTPGVLTQYASMFNADASQWLFLTGDLNYARRIGQDMLHVSVNHRSHFDQLIVMDRIGASRGAFRALQDDQFQRVKGLLAEMLAETPPADEP